MHARNLTRLIHELQTYQEELEVQNDELRQAQQALELSSRRHRDLFDFAPVAYFTLDGTGAILETNLAGAELLRTERNALPRKPFTVFLPAAQHEAFLLHRREVLTTRSHRTHRCGLLRKDGLKVPVQLEASVLLDPDGEPVYCAAVLDLSERLQARRRLQESEERWRFALEGTGDGVWDWHVPSGRVHFSRQWKAMLGYEDHEIGETLDEWSSRVPSEDLEACRDALEAHFRGEAPFYEQEHRVRCKDGSYLWILDRGKVMERAPDGTPVRMLGTHRDVTERRTAEAALHASEIRFRTVFDASPIAALLARSGKTLVANAAYGALLGYPVPEQAAGQPFLDHIAPEARDEVLRRHRLRERGRPVPGHYESIGLRRDGTRFPLRIHAADTYLPDGPATLAFVVDLTETKDAEAKLHDAAERSRLLFEEAADAMLLLRPQLGGPPVVVDINRQGLLLYGEKSKESIVGESVTRWEAPEAHAVAAERAARVMTDGKLCFEVEKRFRDGRRVPLEVNVRRLDLGGVPYLLAIDRDITERRRAERALLESETLYRTLVSGLKESFFVMDSSGTLTYANEAAARLHGVATPAELVGRSAFELAAPEDREAVLRVFAEAMRTGAGPEVFHAKMLRAGGEIFEAEIRPTVVAHADATVTVQGLLSDVTEQKRADELEKLMEAQRRQLGKAESLARMAGAVAHHFNNKLMAVMGGVELALGRLEAEDPCAALLEGSQEAAREAAEVSSLMLSYVGETEAVFEAFDLSEACGEQIGVVAAKLPRGVTLSAAIEPEGITVRGNRPKVREVVGSLLNNAREAIGDGQGTIRMSLRRVAAAETASPHLFPIGWRPEADRYACVEVSDTGCGIAAGQLDEIFDPFFTTKFTGRGLGLAVALGTIRLHGGAVTVASAKGRGSTFRVFFPLEEAGTAEAPVVSRKAAAAGSGLVLVVDDDPRVLKLSRMVLEQLGFEAVGAACGVEGLERFKARRDEYRFVLLDLSMPDMDGWETLAAVRALRPDVPVILASGYDEGWAMRSRQPEQPEAFLHKPYRIADLREAIAAVLGSPSL